VLLRSHHELFGLAAVAFLGYLAHAVLPSTAVLYVGYRYGWGSTAVGFMLAAAGISAMIVQGLLIKPMTARFGERTTLLTGLCCGAIGFSVYGLAASGWIYCAGIPIMACWGLAGPSAQGLMTRRVSASEQGQLQGAIASLSGIAGMIGPGLFSQTFAFFISQPASSEIPHSSFHIQHLKLFLSPLPGAPFLLASMLLLLAMGVAWRATRGRGGKE
jgi:MFS transporter, DHA1 family, tetracycline resistance protein